MLEATEFVHESGSRSELGLKLYALSTCAFCKRAIEFLKSQGLDFHYIYLDKIDVTRKREIKSDLKARYTDIPVFPILTIDDKRAISGFREEQYREALSLDGDVGAD